MREIPKFDPGAAPLIDEPPVHAPPVRNVFDAGVAGERDQRHDTHETHDVSTPPVTDAGRRGHIPRNARFVRIDALTIGTIRLVLPRTTHELARWSEWLDKCLCYYATAALEGHSTSNGVEVDGILRYCVEFTPQGMIRQFLGAGDSRPDPAHERADRFVAERLGSWSRLSPSQIGGLTITTAATTTNDGPTPIAHTRTLRWNQSNLGAFTERC